MEPSPHFNGTTDRYNGVTVDSVEEPCGEALFLPKLKGMYIPPYFISFEIFYLKD